MMPDQASGEGLRQSTIIAVGEWRGAHQQPGLQINNNLQNCAQYLADRIQSGAGMGWVPQEPDTAVNAVRLAKLFYYPADTVVRVDLTPFADPGQLIPMMGAIPATLEPQGKALLGTATDIGVGIAGGPMNLYAVILLGSGKNDPLETRESGFRPVPLNNDFVCDGSDLITEAPPAHPVS